MKLHHTSGAVLLLCCGALAQSDLLVNGDAETGTLAGWTDPLGHGFNVSATVHAGAWSFHPGFTGPTGAYTNELRQDVSVVAFATAIDAGAISSVFTGCGRSNAAGSAVDQGRVELEFHDAAGTILSSYDTGVFFPYNAWQTFSDIRGVPIGTRNLRVRLRGIRGVGGSTDCFFDELRLGVYEWEAAGSGCAGSAGVPDLALVDPPWLGSTYTLDASNLAGGVSFMLTGLTSVNVPLQPFGFGFGPACAQLVAADAVQFVPQVGGSLTWSMALPGNPAFGGLNLWNQVVELSAMSTVSNAAHAVLH